MKSIKKKTTASAPGKTHLLGEHVVVYGKPALLTAVGLRCNILITPHNFKKIEVSSRELNQSSSFDLEEVFSITTKAQKTWENYIKTQDINLLTSITANKLHYPVIAIGETLDHYNAQITQGFKLKINSNIPVGARLGSSAAVAVAIAAGITKFLNIKLDKETISIIAHKIEQKAHGTPSGGDTATACYGGLLWFRNEAPNLKIIHPVPFSLHKSLIENFLLIDTGKPTESTGELVHNVRNLYQSNPVSINKVFDNQEELTRKLLSVLKGGDENRLKEIIRQGQRNLEKLEVSSPRANKIIRKVEAIGGAAKVCGGGGKSENVGIILVYAKDKKKIRSVAKQHQLSIYDANLNEKGVK